MNVIVVDDERIILAVESAEIRKALPDASVESFQSADDALEYAKNNKVDIAFLDINLEEGTGLELSQALQKLNPQVNVIFCTGYSEYAVQAFDLYCSAYLLKPVTADRLREALSHLRYPIEMAQKGLKVQCFGSFEVFYDSDPVKFKYAKTKELLAYLIDRKGALLSTRELVVALFEEEDKSSYIRNLKADLIATFQSLGVQDVLVQDWGKIGVNPDKLNCDYYVYLNGNTQLFQGEYMTRYSFAEDTLATLLLN